MDLPSIKMHISVGHALCHEKDITPTIIEWRDKRASKDCVADGITDAMCSLLDDDEVDKIVELVKAELKKQGVTDAIGS